jgi:hypothetical protein
VESEGNRAASEWKSARPDCGDAGLQPKKNYATALKNTRVREFTEGKTVRKVIVIP